MKKYLLALSTTEYSKEAIDYAIDLARNKEAELKAMFILDSSVPGTVFENLTDIGFIGDKPSTELKEAISKEYEERAKEVLREIKEQAKKSGVPCETLLEEGDFTEKCLEAIARFSADMIILNRSRRSYFSRLFFGSAVDSLLRQAPCEIKIYEEE